MKLIIFICLSSFTLSVKCGLLGGLLDDQLDLSNGKAVKNVVATLDKQTKGVVEDLGELLVPNKNDKSKDNEAVEDTEVKDDKSQDTTAAAASPANNDGNKKKTTQPENPKNDKQAATATEVNKKEDKEKSTTESLITTSTAKVIAKEPAVTEKSNTK